MNIIPDPNSHREDERHLWSIINKMYRPCRPSNDEIDELLKHYQQPSNIDWKNLLKSDHQM